MDVTGHVHAPFALTSGKGWAIEPFWTWWQRELCCLQEFIPSTRFFRSLYWLTHPGSQSQWDLKC